MDIEKVPLGASRMEVAYAIQAPAPQRGSAGKQSEDNTEGALGHKPVSKIVRLFKGSIGAAVEARLGIDRLRAAKGSEGAKDHLGVLTKVEELVYAEPSVFKARLEGKEGWVYVNGGATPGLTFSNHGPGPSGRPEKMDPVFEIAVGDIKRLTRAKALASKPVEKSVDWSADKTLLASLDIEDPSGKTRRFTALPERDELFNRLVAIGSQKWESV
jgi:Protein of unknown function (DUF3292)